MNFWDLLGIEFMKVKREESRSGVNIMSTIISVVLVKAVLLWCCLL